MNPVLLWRLEVGDRVAWLTESLPRDMRWWRGLWDKHERASESR